MRRASHSALVRSTPPLISRDARTVKLEDDQQRDELEVELWAADHSSPGRSHGDYMRTGLDVVWLKWPL